MNPWIEFLLSALLLASSFFTLVGSIGLVRFDQFFKCERHIEAAIAADWDGLQALHILECLQKCGAAGGNEVPSGK